MAGVNWPFKHVVLPETENPITQAGWHSSPDSNSSLQSPDSPLAGAELASQGFGSHVAVVKFPSIQLAGPDTVKPASQPSRQDPPEASVDVQLPTLPLLGPMIDSQGIGEHVDVVSCEFEQLVCAESW